MVRTDRFSKSTDLKDRQPPSPPVQIERLGLAMVNRLRGYQGTQMGIWAGESKMGLLYEQD
jgi:hypothetical protein